MKVLFVVDAGPLVGGGHVMRCLTLAAALRARGADAVFLAPPRVAGILDIFAPDMARLPLGAADELAAAASEATADLVVFDHYGLRAADHRRGRAGRPGVVIDDLADRGLDADLVVDPGAHRSVGQYADLAPGAKILAGARYALVREEFVAARAAALIRSPDRPVARALISMGLTDVGGITARVFQHLRARSEIERIDVLVGPTTDSYAALRALSPEEPRLKLHGLRTDLAAFMAKADLCIGAGGASTWERCVLGLPSITVALADNQRETVEALARRGALLACDADDPLFDQAFAAALGRLMDEPAVRAVIGRSGAALCDGQGAARVADACLALVSS